MTAFLRPARHPDAPACAAILSEWMAETPWLPQMHSPASDVTFMAEKIAEGGTTVADWQGDVAGFVVMEGDYLACLYVAAPARGRGIGRMLVDHAKRVSPGGFTLWTFQANTGARRFYAREGMEAVQYTNGAENDEGLPDVEFCWTPKGRT